MSIASCIDHTLLRQDAVDGDIDRLCAEAAQYHFASVCVSPYYVPRCVRALAGTGVKVCTVIGFPLGTTTPESKVFEALQAVKSGAAEIDAECGVDGVRIVASDKGALDCTIRARVKTAILRACDSQDYGWTVK